MQRGWESPYTHLASRKQRQRCPRHERRLKQGHSAPLLHPKIILISLYAKILVGSWPNIPMKWHGNGAC